MGADRPKPSSRPQTFCSLLIPDIPYYPRPSRSPFTPIPTPSHSSEAPHTHKILQYSSQALHTHLKTITPISGTPYPTKALHTNIRPSIPILGPYTITRLSSPTQDPLNPSQTFHTTLTHPYQFQNPLHTHPDPFTPI